MKKTEIGEKILTALYHYVVFFLMVAFLVTCSMALFLSELSKSLELTYTSENLSTAAKLTFANVLLLSILFTLADFIRRKLTTEKLTKRIAAAARQVVQGEFDVRIAQAKRFGTDQSLNEIIDCFNKMAQELAGVETLRTDFIANVSHEMKTPLAVMQNYGTLLQSPDLEDEKRIAYAKGVTESSRRLADMMSNILKLNRLEKQQIYPKTEEYDLGEQLCECLLGYESVWEKKEIEPVCEIEEGVMVRSDCELLALVWNNLFSNAFKFTPEKGSVSVSLQIEGEYAVVRVKDSGCGMTKEVGEHIFEKFYQGDTSHATQGNGLGLALVKRVIDIMHGEISVESVVNHGTLFTVKIRREIK